MLPRFISLKRSRNLAALAVVFGLAGCGSSTSSPSAAATPDAGNQTTTVSHLDVGCDQTSGGNHQCTEYQDLTQSQSTSIQSQCAAMGGKVLTSTNDTEACADGDTEIGSCEVATGNNIKQFTEYYSDNGFTAAQAQAACTAANGDFK